MKILITGAAGFIGSHLVDFYINEVVTAVYWEADKLDNLEHVKDKIKLVKCDVRKEKDMEKLISNAQPDVILHMAAQSFVTVSWKEPRRTHETNYIGTFNLLEAVRKADIAPIIAIACSSAEYGSMKKEEIPVKETNQLRPTSPYAVSKVGQDMLGHQYNKNYGLKTLRIRFFNISGPRKVNDACSDFAKRVASSAGNIAVGNLEAVRDITDVRDAVRAVDTLVKKGEHGDVYNVCTSRHYKMKDIVDKLIQLSGKNIKPVVDEKLLRPLDDPIFVGDNSKMRALGWVPEIPIEKTLGDMLEWWKKKT